MEHWKQYQEKKTHCTCSTTMAILLVLLVSWHQLSFFSSHFSLQIHAQLGILSCWVFFIGFDDDNKFVDIFWEWVNQFQTYFSFSSVRQQSKNSERWLQTAMWATILTNLYTTHAIKCIILCGKWLITSTFLCPHCCFRFSLGSSLKIYSILPFLSYQFNTSSNFFLKKD